MNDDPLCRAQQRQPRSAATSRPQQHRRPHARSRGAIPLACSPGPAYARWRVTCYVAFSVNYYLNVFIYSSNETAMTILYMFVLGLLGGVSAQAIDCSQACELLAPVEDTSVRFQVTTNTVTYMPGSSVRGQCQYVCQGIITCTRLQAEHTFVLHNQSIGQFIIQI